MRQVLGICILFILSMSQNTLAIDINKSAFRYYTTNNGLSNNFVDCLFKDSKGFLWIGTSYGLNRFDGYRFDVFNTDSPTRIKVPGNFIYSVSEDRFGDVWIGTNHGVCIYSYNTDSITMLAAFPYDQSAKAIIKDSSNHMWVAGNLWVKKYSIEKNRSIKETYHASISEFDMPNVVYETRTLFMEDANTLWIGTSNGLVKHNIKTKSNYIYLNDVSNPTSLPNNTVTCIYKSSTEGLLIGTNEGMATFLPATNNFKVLRMVNNIPGELPHNWVYDITESPNGELIIGTLGGLSIYSLSEKKYRTVSATDFSRFGLNSNYVNCLLTDKEGNVWIGTEGGGLNLYNIYENQFNLYLHEPNNNNTLSSRIVNSTMDDGTYLWVGLAGGGLNRIKKETGQVTHYWADPSNPSTIPNNFISDLETVNGQIWIATWGESLAYLEKEDIPTGRFNRIRYSPSSNKGLLNNFISSIIVDKGGMIWVGTSFGINKINPKTKLVERPSFQYEGHAIAAIGYLMFDKRGNLWICTTDGLYKILADANGNIASDSATIYKCTHVANDPHSLSNNYCTSAFEDAQGNIWIGTYGQGINKLSAVNNQKNIFEFNRITEKQGLCNNIAFGIVQDSHGLLWVATDNGLSCYNPATSTFKSFFEGDGLPGNRFFWNSAYKAPNGEIYFGSTNGLVNIKTQELKQPTLETQPMLTNLFLAADTTWAGYTKDDLEVLSTSIMQATTITVPYKSNEFSIEFSALHFTNPERIGYMYMLENFDEHWNICKPNNRQATYMNLPPGNYTLKVKAFHLYNQSVQSPVRSINIYIPTPFYRSLAFFVLLLAVLAFGLWGIIRLRTYRLRRRTILLEEVVTRRTFQIEEQKEELRIQADNLKDTNQLLQQHQDIIEIQKQELELHRNSLEIQIVERTKQLEAAKQKAEESDQLKTAFLANMSHEIRTPMNAIVGFSSLLNDNDLTTDERANLVAMINSSSESLLHLIDDILDLSMIESNQLKVQFEETSLNGLLDNVHSAVMLINRNPSIDTKLNNSLAHLNLIINTDVFRIKQILLNLMGNALKFTDKGYIEIGVTRRDGNLSFYVHDTGRGISPQELEVIFERFRKVEDDKNRLYRGAGLGLSISRRLSELLGGRMFVESNKSVGSTFYFVLPWTMVKENQTAHEPHKNHSVPMEWSDKSVMIVEDEYSNYLYLEKALTQKNIHTLWAKDGHEAVEYLDSGARINLVLMDINMPNLNGIDAFQIIKNKYPQVVVVAQTAFARYEDENRIRAFGFHDFIGKPIKLKNLYQIIDKYLK